MSLAEEEKLLQASAPHLKKINVVALNTGMRRGEILSQEGKDIDLARQVIVVTHSKTAGGECREIPMTKQVFELLSESPLPEGLIFTYEGKAIHRIKTAWKAAVRRAQIRPFRFKDLRATFNSRLIEAGVIKDVRKELMGHSRNEDTNDLDSHIELPLLREAITKLESWRNKQLQLLRTEVNGEVNGRTSHSGDARDHLERSTSAGNPVARSGPRSPKPEISAGGHEL